MSRVLAVAANAFREGARARFFAGAVLVGLLFLLMGGLVGAMPYGRTDEVIARLAWGAIFLTGLALSSLFAIQYLARERDQRVLHLMLSKPVARWQYGLGKFLGIWALALVTILVEGLALAGLLALVGQFEHRVLAEWLLPSLDIGLKCGVILAFALAFGTLFSPLLAMLLTFTYYLLGAGSQDLLVLAQGGESRAFELLATGLYWLSPRMDLYDLVAWTIYGVEVDPRVYGLALGYYGGYMLLGLFLYLAALEGRELQ